MKCIIDVENSILSLQDEKNEIFSSKFSPKEPEQELIIDSVNSIILSIEDGKYEAYHFIYTVEKT